MLPLKTGGKTCCMSCRSDVAIAVIGHHIMSLHHSYWKMFWWMQTGKKPLRECWSQGNPPVGGFSWWVPRVVYKFPLVLLSVSCWLALWETWRENRPIWCNLLLYINLGVMIHYILGIIPCLVQDESLGVIIMTRVTGSCGYFFFNAESHYTKTNKQLHYHTISASERDS